MDDDKLLELYFNRDEEAIRQTEAKYGAYCFKVANNILCNREDAEECVADTYLKAWNSIPPQRPKVFRLYLARITRNLSLDRYDKQTAQKRGGGETALAIDELTECTAGSANVEGDVMGRMLENSIESFLNGLPEEERVLFLCRYFYMEPVEKIAERLNKRPNSITVKLGRIRKKLRNHLEKEGYFNDRQ